MYDESSANMMEVLKISSHNLETNGRIVAKHRPRNITNCITHLSSHSCNINCF